MSPLDPKVVDVLIDIADDLGIDIYQFIKNWSQTQDTTIYEQLVGGNRYLDLRACYIKTDWYTQHFLIGTRTQVCITRADVIFCCWLYFRWCQAALQNRRGFRVCGFIEIIWRLFLFDKLKVHDGHMHLFKRDSFFPPFFCLTACKVSFSHHFFQTGLVE